ncbi:MAG: SGNH/GDSL hydrolase family protein [Verrucomicrobiota bacterium]
MAETSSDTQNHVASTEPPDGSLVLKRMLLSVVIFLVMLKGVDLLLGWTWQAPVSHTVTRSIILRENPPNQDTSMTANDQQLREADSLARKTCRFRTDKDGFIIGPLDVASTSTASREVDLLFLGGSTTECRYVDEENRFPYRVSQLLQNASGQNLRTLNGGVPGNHSMHSLLNCLSKGLACKPRHVVLMHAVNDLGMLSRTGSYWEAPPGRRLIQEAALEAESGAVKRMAKLGKDLLFPNLWKFGRRGAPDPVDAGVEVDEWQAFRDVRRSPEEVEKILREHFKPSLVSFVQVARAWKTEPILMTQFNRLHEEDKLVGSAYEARSQPMSYADFRKLYQTANEIVREVAAETQTLLIDLDKQVPGDSRHLYDAVHLNDEGSRAVAEIIGQELVRLKPGEFRGVK